MLWRNVKINDKLNSVHVKSTREQICCYDNIDCAFSEFLYAIISFLFRQIAKHNEASVLVFIKLVVHLICKIFSVHKYDSLSVIFERIEYLHDVFNFSTFFAFMVELFNII